MSVISILLVEDDPTFEKLVRKLLQRWDSPLEIRLHVAGGIAEAKKLISKFDFHLLFLDLALRDGRDGGFRLLEELRGQGSRTDVVVMSSTASFESVQRAMRLGANDYLPKGFSQEEFLFAMNRSAERSRWREMENRLKVSSVNDLNQYKLFGSSAAIVSLRESIEKLAPSQVPILIEAETGSGKELVARNLHLRGRDPTSSFVAVDCGAIPESMAESSFFGHERGSFTGADEQRIGIFEQANGGTLFLDEISNLSLDMQNKLLRAIQEREIRRVGGRKTISVDFRLISAANQSLDKLVEQKKFKQDLYFRINVIQLALPPLRDRREDIPELLNHFLQGKQIDADLLSLLQTYSWPGNIRELKNLVSACLAMAGDKNSISISDLPPSTLNRIIGHNEIRGNIDVDMATRFRISMEEAERRLLTSAYHSVGGNISELARLLELDRSNLHKKLVKYEIHQIRS